MKSNKYLEKKKFIQEEKTKERSMNSRTSRIVILTITGTFFSYKLVKSSEDDFLFDGFMFLIIAVVGLSLLIRTIFKDYKEYSLTKQLTSYFPTFTGLFFIGLILCINFYQDRKINAETLLSGYYDGGFNGFSIDFKANGNYIMANGSGLGQVYFYGTYTIKDSVITIDKSTIDNVITSNRFVVRNAQYFLPLNTVNKVDTTKANYFTQIDKQGKEIDSELRFRVTSDNRTKK